MEQEVVDWCVDNGIRRSSSNKDDDTQHDDKRTTTINLPELHFATTYGTCILYGNRFVIQFTGPFHIGVVQFSSVSISDVIPMVDESAEVKPILPLDVHQATWSIVQGPVLESATIKKPGKLFDLGALHSALISFEANLRNYASKPS